jgi:hypothetical protein
MRLEPFERVDGRCFSTTRAEVVASLGPPLREAQNGVGLYELDYGTVVYRFQLSGRLEEVTVDAPVLHVDKVSVPFASLESLVCSHDEAAFRRAGFIVSPRYGLAFDPSEPSWVTALARHCLVRWEEL